MIWSPSNYTKAAVVADEAGEEMLTRLEFMTLKPTTIIDAGCGTAALSEKLQKRYPEAQVIAIDNSLSMLEHAKKSLILTCAEAENLPLRAHSVDLIFANFLIPWHANLKQLFSEWRRVLKPDGLLMLTALGLDTLNEWRSIFAAEKIIPELIDIHDFGDLLIQEGFADPVLDVSHYTLEYDDKNKLFAELNASGMLKLMPLIPTVDLIEMPPFSATFEVIHAHAFAPSKTSSTAGEVKIPLDLLRKSISTQFP